MTGTALDLWRCRSDKQQYRSNLCLRLNVIHKNKSWGLLRVNVSQIVTEGFWAVKMKVNKKGEEKINECLDLVVAGYGWLAAWRLGCWLDNGEAPSSGDTILRRFA